MDFVFMSTFDNQSIPVGCVSKLHLFTQTLPLKKLFVQPYYSVYSLSRALKHT